MLIGLHLLLAVAGRWLAPHDISAGDSLASLLPPSVELVGKSEQFPGIPWNATVFAIVGFVIVLPRQISLIPSRDL